MERREGSACVRGVLSSCWAGATARKIKPKFFEIRQGRQAIDHGFGGKVLARGNFPKGKSNKTRRRRKSSFGNAGKSTPSWWSDRRRGADPPRKESGRVGDTATCERKRRSVSAGYGSYVTFLFLV